MPRYILYLIQHLAWPTLVITASLTGIIWLTQALRFIDFMISRGLSAGDFMYLTGLMVPSLLLPCASWLLLLLPCAFWLLYGCACGARYPCSSSLFSSMACPAALVL